MAPTTSRLLSSATPLNHPSLGAEQTPVATSTRLSVPPTVINSPAPTPTHLALATSTPHPSTPRPVATPSLKLQVQQLLDDAKRKETEQKLSDAAKLAQRAALLDPANEDASLRAVTLTSKAGDHVHARELAQEYLKRFPTSPHASLVKQLLANFESSP